MKLKNNLKSSLMMAFAALSFFTSAANAIMLDIESGTNALLGIDDINIQGTLWDVDFGDGIWHEIDGDFATNNNPVYATAFALTKAQLDIGYAEIKDFLDSSAAVVGGIDYGNSAQLINGCERTRCAFRTPHAVILGNPNSYSTKSLSMNNIATGVTDNSRSFISKDMSLGGETYAVWTKAQVSAVPEPASYAMLLAGLGLLGLARRRQQA